MAAPNTYSTVVSWAKIILPLVALGLLSTLFLFSRTPDPNRAIPFAAVDVEELAREQPATFDVVTCMEMLEHVPEPGSIIQACHDLVKPGGHVFFSTINRNPKAYFLLVLGAEYILNLLPRGTHEYEKFIKPSELARAIRAAGLEVLDISGMTYNPFSRRCTIGRDVDANYLIHARKPE